MTRLMPSRTLLPCAVAAAATWLGSTTAARAHPHVFVTTAASVVFEKNAITAIDHVWTFDEFYSAMAVEGLDTNKDGKFSREELDELAKTNIEGLKDFEYFTYPKLADKALKSGEPKDYWLEHKDGVLALHFRLPLESPVAIETKGFNFSIYDSSYFIGFEFAKTNPVSLAGGAPKSCSVALAVPQKEAADAKRLGEAFFEQLGGANYGLSVAKTAFVDCGGK